MIEEECDFAAFAFAFHFEVARDSRGRMHREKISPDLVVQLFQLHWEESEREKAAAAAAAEGGDGVDGVDGDGDGGGGRAARKFSIKDEAVLASAEVLRHFAAEIVHRAVEIAAQDGDDTVDGGHLERILPQLMLDFAT